ncbi:MAG: hypothetical protein AAGI28_12600 [Pseudomonadota bacterium]
MAQPSRGAADLSRQANASSAGFFADFNRIQDLTEQAIFNAEQDVPGEGSDIFSQQTAENTSGMAATLADVRALLQQAISNDNGQPIVFGGGGKALGGSGFSNNASFV